MQEYHTESEGILEYINALEAAQKKSKRGTGNNPITDATLLLIATNAILNTGAHPRTTDKWEDLHASHVCADASRSSHLSVVCVCVSLFNIAFVVVRSRVASMIRLLTVPRLDFF